MEQSSSTTEKVSTKGSSERYVRLGAMCKLIDAKERTVLDWIRKYEDFPVLRLPGAVRFRPTEVLAWLEKRAFKPHNRVSGKEQA